MFTNIRRLIFLFLVGIFLAIISACGDSVVDNLSDSANQEQATPCRMVKHAMGETCVPDYPERVVSLGDTANTVALGVKPVAGGFSR